EDEAAVLGDPANGAAGPREASVLDLATGSETRNPGFNQNLHLAQKPYWGAPLLPAGTSPDGAHVLWVSDNPTGREDVIVTTLDGNVVGRWPAKRTSYANILQWLPDGQSWVRISYNPNGIGLSELTRNNLRAPDKSVTVPFPVNHVGGCELGFSPDG